MQTLSSIYSVVSWIVIFLDFIMLAVGAFLFVLAQKYRPNITPHRPNARTSTLSRSILRESWAAIVNQFNEGTSSSMKLAVIEADKLVDHILKESGFKGEHMADRLEKLSVHGLQTFERLWRAHKIRNEIVHSIGSEVPPQEAKQAMEDYEAFLKEVRILY
jgi:hypothetical protein